MRRLTTLFLSLLVLTALTTPAQASVKWCPDKDPIVTLNGTEVQILVSVPEQYVELVNGPSHFEIQTPAGTKTETIFTDDGLNDFREVVEFTDLGRSRANGSMIPTRIIVQIPIDESQLGKGEQVPVRLTVISDGKSRVTYGTHEQTVTGLAVQSSN